jgi:MoaA/NifB/PqqE/SkfB family radical SAM enzyme
VFKGVNLQKKALPNQPGVLLIHLLDRCNLVCRHCYLEASPAGKSLLPGDLVLRCLEETDRLGIATVYLSGGEPFLHPAIEEILEEIGGRQDLNLVISTNGTLINKKAAGQVKRSRASVQVSLDGPQKFHDDFRGANDAFKRTIRGMENLVSFEIPVTIVATVNQDNLQHLHWLADFAKELGVERLSIQPLLLVGRGAEIRDKALTIEQMCDLFFQLSDFGHAYRPNGLKFSLAYRTKKFLTAHPCAAYVCNGEGCHRKVSKELKKLVIREDGTVLPEIPTINPEFSLGNIYQDTLQEMVGRYMQDGYERFEVLCRQVYQEVILNWDSPLIPLDEIVSRHSYSNRT